MERLPVRLALGPLSSSPTVNTPPYVDPFYPPYTGFHATDAASFADQIHTILSLSSSSQLAIRENARRQAMSKFSTEVFEQGWQASYEKLARNAEKRIFEVELEKVKEDQGR
jgi:glycosyltransferase involved in cell wall biosynthesis